MFAVIETGGKQYHVTTGDVIKVERLAQQNVGDLVSFTKVLALEGKVGRPFIEGATVKAELLEQARTEKVIVFKKRRRKNYRRKHGHKQDISVLRIKEIIG
jgi:large subunit ribosomal protein L21